MRKKGEKPVLDPEQEHVQCKGTTGSGKRCEAPPELVTYAGYCYTHSTAPEVVQARKLANLRGGLSTGRSSRQAFRLDMAALPPLVTIAAAEVWSAAVAKAVLAGQLTGPSSQAALRAIREFRMAHEQNQLVQRLARVEEELRKQNGRRGTR